MSSIADDITRSQFSSSATSSTSKNHRLATIAGFLPISFFIVCWYWSSSINAVATQRLLSQNDASHGEANHDASEVHSPSSMLAAVLLTAAQLVVGSMASLVLIWISKFVLPSYSISAIASSSSSSSHVIVGLLHCIGCLCTNIGFAFGSASLVQVIKLLEPIETLLLSAIVIVLTNTDYATRISEILSVKKMASTFIIVGGTSMLLAQKEMEANYKSIVFALGSGFCMALRNVLKKNGGDRDTNYKRGRSVKEEKLPSSCGEVFLKGMYNFTLITTMSAIPAALIALLAMLFSNLSLKAVVELISHKNDVKTNLIQAVIFHCLYNMSSITVLSLTSAPVHSLLNVGKRIANVLSAAVVFSVPLTYWGKIGILLAGMGALLHIDDSTWILSGIAKSRHYKHRRTRVFVIWIVSMNALWWVGMQSLASIANGITTAESMRHLGVHPSVAHSSSIVVWMYPFPPPSSSNSTFVVKEGESLICPYRMACQGKGSPINMAHLTEGTFFHNFLLDHPYRKLLHFEDFNHREYQHAHFALLICIHGASHHVVFPLPSRYASNRNDLIAFERRRCLC